MGALTRREYPIFPEESAATKFIGIDLQCYNF
jgi:hypothetical protein